MWEEGTREVSRFGLMIDCVASFCSFCDTVCEEAWCLMYCFNLILFMINIGIENTMIS